MSHDFMNSSMLIFMVVCLVVCLVASDANTAGAAISDTAIIELASMLWSFIAFPLQLVVKVPAGRMRADAGW